MGGSAKYLEHAADGKAFKALLLLQLALLQPCIRYLPDGCLQLCCNYKTGRQVLGYLQTREHLPVHNP